MKEKFLKYFYIVVICLLLILLSCVGMMMFMLLNQYPIAHLIIGGLFTILVGIGIIIILAVASWRI